MTLTDQEWMASQERLFREVEADLVRAPFLKFAQSHAELGGTTPGAIGLPHDACRMLERVGLLWINEREAQVTTYRWSPTGGTHFRRRYWTIVRGVRMREFRDLFHAELRGRNLPLILDIDDGYGRAEFRKAWHQEGRAPDIRAAALAAWRKVKPVSQAELAEMRERFMRR